MFSLEYLYKLRQLKDTSKARFVEIYKQLSPEMQEYIALHPYFDRIRLNQITPWHLKWQMELDIPGRGWGKNFKLSFNVVELATNPELIQHFTGGKGKLRINIYGETITECVDTIITGDSGIEQELLRRGYILKSGGQRDKPGKNEVLFLISEKLLALRFNNGTIVRFYGAGKTKGKQSHVTFADEVLTYFEDTPNVRDQRLEKFYQECMTTARLGPDPRVVWSSTPRAVPVFKHLLERAEKHKDVLILGGSTYDNPALAKTYLDNIEREYGGTRRGLQEIYGKIVWEVPGALWKECDIQHQTLGIKPEYTKIVVSIDPAVSNNKESDETGIVVTAKTKDSYFVLKDSSGRYSPLEWAKEAVKLYDQYQANMIVYESNQGGDMVAQTLRTVRRDLSIKAVRASKGKYARAEPIAALYEQHRVIHLGFFPELEKQMMEYNPDYCKGSPDRLDALVWGLHELSTKETFEPFWT